MLRSQLHVQQSEEVVDLRQGGDSTLASATARALLDSYRRGYAIDRVNVRSRRRLHKLTRVRIQRFEIAPLALVEKNVEGKCGFARARDAE